MYHKKLHIKKSSVFLILMIQSLCLISCTENANQDFNGQGIKTDNNYTNILYNPFIQQLIKYDAGSGGYIEWKPNIDGQFQYMNPYTERFVFDGHSTKNDFALLQIEGEKINTVHNFGEGEGAFPIGLANDKLYFIHTLQFEDSNNKIIEKRHVAYYDLSSKSVKDLEKTDGLITEGSISKDSVYYTVYKPTDENYSLYKLPFSSIENPPILVDNNIETSEVLIKDNVPCKINNDFITCDKSQWEKRAVNYIVDNKLIQIDVEGSVLDLSVTDMKTDTLDYEASNIIGINFSKEGIHIGSRGVSKYKW